MAGYIDTGTSAKLRVGTHEVVSFPPASAIFLRLRWRPSRCGIDLGIRPSMGRGECAVGDFSCATGTKTRYDLGKYLDARGYTSGVELGVQRGRFSRAMLAGWPRCEL